MRKKMSKRMLATMLATVTAVATLSACGQSQVTSTETTKNTEQQETVETNVTSETTETVVDKSKLPTLSLYYYNANLTAGLVEGYRGDYFAEEGGFNVEVWAYSEDKTNAIMASGDLPDIMFLKKGDNLDALIEGKKIINYDDYADQLPNLYAYESNAEAYKTAVDINRVTASAGTNGLYFMPTGIGPTGDDYGHSATGSAQVKLKWDVYEEIGTPEINDYWELIDVMEQMLKAHPAEADGTKCFGTFLDNQDSTFFGAVEMWYVWQGYVKNNLQYMIETNAVTDEHKSILTKDSLYYEGLKWYNECYRRGLIDPDSINTDRGTQAKKIDAGYAMVPAGTLPGYAPIYYEYYIPGTNIYNASVTTSSNYGIVINAETEHLEECLEFVNMWLAPETYLNVRYGNEGSIWYAEGDTAYLTDEFIAWVKAGNNPNGFAMSDGTEWSLWNISYCSKNGTLTKYKDADGNPLPAEIMKWPQYLEASSSENPTLDQWKETMGYDSWNDLVNDKGVYYSESNFDYYKGYLSSTPPEDSMKLTISSLKDTLVTAGWKMVYAESEAEFDEIWDKMIKDCEELGAQKIIDWKLADIENARKLAGK